MSQEPAGTPNDARRRLCVIELQVLKTQQLRAEVVGIGVSSLSGRGNNNWLSAFGRALLGHR
ncbi:MAG: hypothetical protein MHM6MM_003656 [Cercozoa sp. M6MM]